MTTTGDRWIASLRSEVLQAARILIVDDSESELSLFCSTLAEFGYCNVRSTTDSSQALAMFMEFDPDLALVDVHMPGIDGVQLIRQFLVRIPEGSYLPILVVTGDSTPKARERALSACAKDFLTKPFDPLEIHLRIKNLLETRFLYLRLERQNQVLEARVQERTRELEETHLELLERLALTAEYRDDQTSQHTRRVGDLAARLAQALGLRDQQVDLIRKATVLHDVGKVGVPDAILHKPGPLLAEEFRQVRPHTVIGAGILSGSKSPLLRLAEEIALYHHERWDGAGYSRLRGEAIPLAARITAVADTFDVLTHDRPYRKAVSVEGAVAEIQRESGKQFDPHVVEALLHLDRHADVDY